MICAIRTKFIKLDKNLALDSKSGYVKRLQKLSIYKRLPKENDAKSRLLSAHVYNNYPNGYNRNTKKGQK